MSLFKFSQAPESRRDLTGAGASTVGANFRKDGRFSRAGTSPRPFPVRSDLSGPCRVGAWACPRPGCCPGKHPNFFQFAPVGLIHTLRYIIMLMFILLISSCAFPGTQQAQQPDLRLKSFHVLSERIIILDTQAEVDGTVQNTGHDRYPYDVTLMATFYNSAGNVIGQAQGVAEDVLPGMTSPFVLMGQVDSSQYSRLVVTPISLRERRIEKNTPTPPPIVP